MLRKLIVMTFLAIVSASASAHDYHVGDIHIDHPWSRAMPDVAPTAAVYFVLENQGAEADRLVKASTPVAQKAEIHEHQHVDGMMKMVQVDGVTIPAHSDVKFEPMGYHVMLFGVKQQAKVGERFTLRLTFEKAGSVDVEVAVQADQPASGQHDHGAAHQHAQ